MSTNNHPDQTDRLDGISQDPLKDLFDLIDIQQSPVNSQCNYVEPDNLKLNNILVGGSVFSI